MLHWLAKTDGEGGAFLKRNRHPSGGNCFVLTTPGGEKLAGGNGSGGAASALAEGLAKWKKLPEAQRKALPRGESLSPPEASRCTPPPGGLVLRSYIRNLKRGEGGRLEHITRDDLKDRKQYPDWNPIYTEPAHYHVWLTEAEWKSLVPASPKKGDRFPVPDGICKRIFRYHLVNGTFGLPGVWRLEDIRSGELTLKVETTSPTVRLRLEGSARLATDANLDKAPRGYDVRLTGVLEYDSDRKAFSRFDVVAVGDYWGGDYEGGRFKRPGRTPLGIAFELARGTSAVDLAPPLVHMDRKEQHDRYFAAERP
ncbi:MAG TPA: hypothetical protein VKD72_19335 [Gemmataceae bacterium]|nr:hypothetical protein [Gemmataceae bacterium]